MQHPNVAAIVLAAGQGTRMKSSLPKVLHQVAGRAMVAHVLEAACAAGAGRLVVVVGRGMERVQAAVAPALVAIQDPPLGTGHAVMAALPILVGSQGAVSQGAGFKGDVVVLFGDTPLITGETIARMVASRRAEPQAALAVLGFEPDDPKEYGRLILGADGRLDRIVEAKDATRAESATRLCNSGVMVIDGARLPALLERLTNTNAKGEYYLTDIVALARADGHAALVVRTADIDETMGVNSRAELAKAEAAMQARLRARAMAGGATLIAPETVFFAADTVIGRDVVIGPQVVFGRDVRVEDDVEIRAFCHIEGARIARGAVIGPFARLRPGADIGADAHVGNFVEVKNTRLEEGAKANHLTYLGDARVGARANVGAGTITCNYDGFLKSQTDIGAGAFIGSNTALVAPVKIGDGAIIGAGSTIAEDVPADALAVTRAAQVVKPAAAKRYRERKKAEKAAKGAGKPGKPPARKAG